MGQEPGRPYLRLHVRQLERDRLVLGYGLAERGTLHRVAGGVAEGALGDAEGLRGDPDPAEVQRSERHLEPLRSEEHTSELQSRQYLVCRLLLEKKKTSEI